MESTGKYWIPVYNILEPTCTIVLAHPKYVKAIRGKKTDKRDAKWIADIFKHDLVAGSFIPPADIRQLKENQPSLQEAVRLFFEDDINRAEWESCVTTEKNAGRIEERICRKATDISWLSDQKWPGLQSVFAIERIVEDHGHHSKETSYYISSRDASPRQLMDYAREHWKIESMHRMLDVTFSEDSCRLLSENAHKTLNSLCKFALAVHKQFLLSGHKNSSMKSSMLSALLRNDYLLEVLQFL